jgi:hypothetical protein
MSEIKSSDCGKKKLTADEVLKDAFGELQDAVVLGWDEDGRMYFQGNIDLGSELLWLLETAKANIMNGYVDEAF